jgi:Sap, sulfolipid-1-addressing protein
VNAEFFALAFTAALNPKLLALDLLLIENRRPRAMFMSILAGGLGVAVAIGVVDVLFVRADAVKSQGKPSAGVDLALGLILLALGALLVTGVLPRRRRTSAPAAEPKPKRKKKEKGDGWAQRALREPRLGLAFAIGVVCGLPGASYLAALHNLIAGKYPTPTQVGAVLVFAIIEFLLIIIPWVFLELRPEGTAALLRRSQAWLASHAKQLMAWIAVLLGAYLAISALVRLL